MLKQPRIGSRCKIAVVALSVVTALVGCSARNTPAPVETLYTGKTYKDYDAGSIKSKTYQVQQGETLYSIAFRANLDVKQLVQLNNLSKPYTIYPGQRLRIAADVSHSAKTVSVAKTKSNNNNVVQTQNDIKRPVAKPTHKEYGQKVAEQKKVAKQPAKRKPSNKPKAQATSSKTQVTPVPRRVTSNVSNADLNWQWPSAGKIIEGFSVAETGNKGIDFAGQRGDPVQAAAAGKVVYVGDALRGFGRLIILKHNDDFITAYAHNEKILVDEQDWVDVGDVIAEMGDSGTQRIKLHFEVRFRGKSVNPRHYLPKSR